MRKPSAYRKGRNLYHYAKALVELDRAEAAAERQRQHTASLVFGTTSQSVIQRAMKTYHLALFRTHYARQNVAHYGRKVKQCCNP